MGGNGNLKADLVVLFPCARRWNYCIWAKRRFVVYCFHQVPRERGPTYDKRQHPPVYIQPCTESSTYCEGPGSTCSKLEA